MSKKYLAHLALLVVNLIYGGSHFIAKTVMPDYLTPNVFIFFRVLSATLLFWILRIFVKEKVAKKDLGLMAVCGVFGVALNQLLFFQGLSITSPVDSAIIMVSSPVIVTFLSFLILKSKLTKTKVSGILLGLIGAIFLIYLGDAESSKISSLKGNLFILANATSYSLYIVLVKPLMKKYKPITVISYVFLFGLVIVFPFGISEMSEITWAFPNEIILAIGFIILFTTFITYLFNIFGVKYLSPIITSSYIYLQPVFAMVIGLMISWYGNNDTYVQSITWEKIACTLLIFIGVFLTSFNFKAKD